MTARECRHERVRMGPNQDCVDCGAHIPLGPRRTTSPRSLITRRALDCLAANLAIGAGLSWSRELGSSYGYPDEPGWDWSPGCGRSAPNWEHRDPGTECLDCGAKPPAFCDGGIHAKVEGRR